MNNSSLAAAIAAVTLAGLEIASAQEIVVKERVETPSTVVGSVASVDLAASTIMLSSEGTTAPIKYAFTDETEFVDGAGQALTHEALREGESASLQYFRAGDKMVVLKVVIAPPIASETTKTAVIQSAPVTVSEEKMAVEKTVEPATKKKVTKKPTPKKATGTTEKKKTVTKARRPKVVEEEKKSTTTTTTESR